LQILACWKAFILSENVLQKTQNLWLKILRSRKIQGPDENSEQHS